MIRSFCSATCSFVGAMRSAMLLSLTVLTGFAVASPAQMRIKHPAGPEKHPDGTPYVYKTVAGRKLHLYVLEPTDTAAQPHPTIIFFHGGGWVAGAPPLFNPQAEYLAARGMVAIEVEYRLLARGGDASPQICMEDAKSAIRWVRSHAGQLNVDPNRIVESGGSAGGYLAAFASMVPGWNDPQDDVTISTRANLLALFNPVIDNSPTGYGYKRFGAGYKRYSPIFYVTPDTPPTLIQSGEEDKLIHAPVLEELKKSYEHAGVPMQLILYKGAEHGFFNKEPYLTQTNEALAQFLRQQGYLQ